MNYVIINTNKTTKMFAENISLIIIDSDQSVITTHAINFLASNGIMIIYCDNKHLPNAYSLGYNTNCDAPKNLMIQVQWKDKIKAALWTNIIKNKITNQTNVLKDWKKMEYLKEIKNHLEEIEFDDKTNKEGSVARLYFSSLFNEGFNRNDADNVFNKCLDYLYTVLTAIFARTIAIYGYNNQLGIKHCNTFNFWNLACDFIEPFRPIVDDYILTNKIEEFDKKRLLNFVRCQVKWKDKWYNIQNAIYLYVGELLNFLNEKSVKFFSILEYDTQIDEKYNVSCEKQTE